MPGDIDKSLLERLQALRGSSSSASSQAAPIKYEMIFQPLGVFSANEAKMSAKYLQV